MLPSDEGKDLPPKIRAEDSDKWLAGVLAPGSFPMQYYDDFQSVPPERFAPKRFSIMLASGIPQPEANSYLLNPNGKAGILIPVSRANTYSRQEGLGEVLGNNTAFGVRMVWNEQPGTGSGSNIRMVKAAGRGRTDYILVLPGTMSGNAVVAATDAAGKILWSWHLWVTTYSPDTNQGWMDRHLGAMANSKEAGSAAFGLLYQWGRKGPFPSTSAVLYYGDEATGELFPGSYKSTTQYTLQQSVENSHIRVQHGTNGLKDAGNSTSHWSDLWGGEIVSKDAVSATPTRKSVFDPCPAGWKVPSFGDEGWGTGTTRPSSSAHDKYGDYLPDKGGWYPITGQLLGNSTAFGHTDEGYCWTSSVRPSDPAPYYLVIRYKFPNHLVINPMYNRGTGMSVRCVCDK